MGDVIPNTRFVRTTPKERERLRRHFARRPVRRRRSEPGVPELPPHSRRR